MSLKLLLLIIVFSQSALALIFDHDKRLDIDQVKNSKIQNLAKSVFTFIPKDKFQMTSDGSFKFTQQSDLQKNLRLCENEKFADQISVGTRCTGFLVDPHHGLTAGHCVSPLAIKNFCNNYYIVFDYIKTNNIAPTQIPKSSVRECDAISKIVFNPNQEDDDYAVLHFKTPVTDRQPLKLRKSGHVKNSEALFMLGYPRGMAQKISIDAQVLKQTPRSFSTNLDCFHGNSGSPVFNAKTLLVEGIFVRGSGDIPNNSSDPELVGDFRDNPEKNCRESIVCRSQDNCNAAMEATKITRVSFK